MTEDTAAARVSAESRRRLKFLLRGQLTGGEGRLRGGVEASLTNRGGGMRPVPKLEGEIYKNMEKVTREIIQVCAQDFGCYKTDVNAVMSDFTRTLKVSSTPVHHMPFIKEIINMGGFKLPNYSQLSFLVLTAFEKFIIIRFGTM